MAFAGFYPGYQPDSKSNNPLIPGYYPGKTMPRKYVPKYKLQPIDFDTDIFAPMISIMEDQVLNTIDVPRYVKERIISDFEQQLKVAIRPESISAEQLDDFNIDDLPGAVGLSIDLNPVKWIKDPKKMAVETLKNWWDTATNLTDLETKAKYGVYRRLVEGDTLATGRSEYSQKMGGAIVSQIETGMDILSQGLPGLEKSKESGRYKVTGLGVMSKVLVVNPFTKKFEERYIDAGDAFAKQYGNFFNNINSAATVRGAYTDLISSYALGSQLSELQNDFYDEDRSDPLNIKRTIKSTLPKNVQYAVGGRMNLLSTAVAIGGLDSDLRDFQSKAKAAATHANGYNTSEMRRTYFKAIVSFSDNKESIRRQLEELKEYSPETYKHFAASWTELLGMIEDTETKAFGGTVDNLIKILESNVKDKNGQPISFKNLNSLEKADLIKSSISNLIDSGQGNLLAGYKNLDFLIGKPEAKVTKGMALGLATATETLTTLRPFNKPLKQGDSVTAAHYEDILSYLVEEDVRGESDLTKLAASGEYDFKFTRLLPHIRLARQETLGAGERNIIDLFFKGKLMEVFVWSRFNNVIRYATPSYWMGEIMKRTHYFGLSIDSRLLDYDMEDMGKFADAPMLTKWLLKRGWLGKKEDPPSKLFGNYFDIAFGVPSATGGLAIKAKGLWGGAHFKGIRGLARMINSKEDDWGDKDVFKVLWDATGKHIAEGKDPKTFDVSEVIAGLAGKRLAVFRFNENKDAQGNLATMGEHLINLRKYLEKNKSKFGNDFDINDPTHIMALINSLNDRNKIPDYLVKIDSKYAGLLQKLATKINILQTKVFRRLQGLIRPIGYAKLMIKNLISNLVRKGIALIAGGGIASVAVERILMLIKPVIDFVVDKLFAWGKELLVRGILKGDIFGAITNISKDIDKMVQKMLSAVLLPLGFVVFFMSFTSGFLIGSLPRQDPSVGNAGLNTGGDVGLPGGWGTAGCPTCTPGTTVKCFEFMEGSGSFQWGSKTYTTVPWPTSDRQVLENAAKNLPESYKIKLCDDPKNKTSGIKVFRVNSGDMCGLVMGNVMYFGSLCDYSPSKQTYYNYLFAHESGHVYANTFSLSTAEFNFSNILETEGPMRTYKVSGYANHCPGSAGPIIPGEDFAEMIGNRVAVNGMQCPNVPSNFDTFWAAYPLHKAYADVILGFGGQAEPPPEGSL